MVRGIPWDDLHLNNDENNNNNDIQSIEKGNKDANNNNDTVVEVERNWEKDLISIGRRTAFGVVVYPPTINKC
jgi:hypothetical protein